MGIHAEGRKMRGYFKRMLRKMGRPFKRMKGYIQFFQQKDMYQELDDIKIRRVSKERLEEEEKKVKRRIKILEKFENWPIKILTLIIPIFLVIGIIHPKIYWVATLANLVASVVYAIGYIVLMAAYVKAKSTLEANSEVIEIEKNRRKIKRREYSDIETIDSPRLCAIMVKATRPIIDEIRTGEKVYYNVYVNGIRYKLKEEHKLEELME